MVTSGETGRQLPLLSHFYKKRASARFFCLLKAIENDSPTSYRRPKHRYHLLQISLQTGV